MLRNGNRLAQRKIWCYSSKRTLCMASEQLAGWIPPELHALDLSNNLFLGGAVRLLVPVLMSAHFAKQGLIQSGLRHRFRLDFPCGPAAAEGRSQKSPPARPVASGSEQRLPDSLLPASVFVGRRRRPYRAAHADARLLDHASLVCSGPAGGSSPGEQSGRRD